MKWMLATILSVVMVAPAFASVDITLTPADGTALIELPSGTTAGTLTLKLGLANFVSEAGEEGIAGYNVALNKVAVAGTGTFKISARAAGNSVDTVSPYGNVVNSVLAPTSADVGGYNGNWAWMGTDINTGKNTMNVFTLAYSGLADGDVYTISLADPVGGKVIASDEYGMPVTVGSLGSVTVKVLVPEPASVLLLAFGGLFLRRRHA